jgi:phosphatidylserine decarboxylase
MTIHKEGYRSIAIAVIIFGVINILSYWLLNGLPAWITTVIFFITLLLLLFIISFFRIPDRTHTTGENKIICPADGKVVTIEEITDEEYFKDRRIQLSVFMSPANVHVNRYPVSGKIVYSQYHPGKYLVAWHPKSSTENERYSTVVETPSGKLLLVKQIAGAVAKRICNYATAGNTVKQNEELGFIKFGSRVDLLLPLGAKINVKLNEVVKGGVTVLAEW